MDSFFEKFSFILAFMILIVFFNMLFGTKATEYFLMLVLLGMVLINYDDVLSIFRKLG